MKRKTVTLMKNAYNSEGRFIWQVFKQQNCLMGLKKKQIYYIYMSNGVGLYRKMLSDSWTQWEYYCSYLYIIISNINLGPDRDRKIEQKRNGT